MNASVCPSVHPFSLCSHHCIIMKFSVIAIGWSDIHAKGQVQRSQRSKPNLAVTWLTPVWIHIWQWNNAQRLMWHRRGALLFFKVIRQTSRSHGTKNCWFWPELAVPDYNFSLNKRMAMNLCIKLGIGWMRCPIVFEGHASNCKVIRDKKLLIFTWIWRFRTVTAVWIDWWQWNDAQSLK